MLLAACMFESQDPDAEGPGYVSLGLVLAPSGNALLKSASADTIFRVDTLVIVLSANGAATQTNKYAISGRPDSASIVVPTKVFSLASLRTWTAKVYTIDTTFGSGRIDTVHNDSTTFFVKPSDTTDVTFSVRSAFSILRARFVSTAAGSIANPIKWVRLRVDGTMKDSIAVGKPLHSAIFGNGTNGAIVGDSGAILYTSNAAVNWTLATSPTTANLYSVDMGTAATWWAVGAGGAVIRTTNSGAAWSNITSGTTANLYATAWSSASNGWVAGAGGVIRTTANSGTLWTPQTSGTTADIYGIYFWSATVGLAVGAGGVSKATTDGGLTWTNKSTGTSQNLNGVFMISSTVGFAVGNGGVILKYASGAWTAQSSNLTKNLNGVFFTTTSNGTVVGDSGTILTTTNGGTNWTSRNSGTSNNLDGVSWTTNDAAGVAVGAFSAISYTTTNSTFAYRPFGAKTFDLSLTYKYLTPDVSHTLLLDAIDTTAGALRGYKLSTDILLSAGKDSTVTPSSALTACGGSNPACP